MIVQTCPILPGECVEQHTFPDDWEFGGPSGSHPAADPRFVASSYTYFDADLTILDITSEFTCDEAALDACTKLAGRGRAFNPRWVQVIRPGGEKLMLPWTYDKSTDTLAPTG